MSLAVVCATLLIFLIIGVGIFIAGYSEKSTLLMVTGGVIVAAVLMIFAIGTFATACSIGGC